MLSSVSVGFNLSGDRMLASALCEVSVGFTVSLAHVPEDIIPFFSTGVAQLTEGDHRAFYSVSFRSTSAPNCRRVSITDCSIFSSGMPSSLLISNSMVNSN